MTVCACLWWTVKVKNYKWLQAHIQACETHLDTKTHWSQYDFACDWPNGALNRDISPKIISCHP